MSRIGMPALESRNQSVKPEPRLNAFGDVEQYQDIENLYSGPSQLSAEEEEFNVPRTDEENKKMLIDQDRTLALQRHREVMPPSPVAMMNDIYHLKGNVTNLFDKVSVLEVNTRNIGNDLGKVAQQQKTTFNTLNYKIDQLDKAIHQPQQSSSRNLNLIYENDDNNNNNPLRPLREDPVSARQRALEKLIRDSPRRRDS